MTRRAIIEKTLQVINSLPDDKAEEIADFAAFVMKRFEEHQLTAGLQAMAADSNSFAFLADEEDLYTVADLKVKYNG